MASVIYLIPYQCARQRGEDINCASGVEEVAVGQPKPRKPTLRVLGLVIGTKNCLTAILRNLGGQHGPRIRWHPGWKERSDSCPDADVAWQAPESSTACVQ
jgi:hypothetical protein